MHTFTPEGVCAKAIHFEIEDNVVQKVVFEKGCPGSLHGIANLVVGLEVEDVMQRLKGIPCGPRATSCPDQLYKALEAHMQKSA